MWKPVIGHSFIVELIFFLRSFISRIIGLCNCFWIHSYYGWMNEWMANIHTHKYTVQYTVWVWHLYGIFFCCFVCDKIKESIIQLDLTCSLLFGVICQNNLLIRCCCCWHCYCYSVESILSLSSSNVSHLCSIKLI